MVLQFIVVWALFPETKRVSLERLSETLEAEAAQRPAVPMAPP